MLPLLLFPDLTLLGLPQAPGPGPYLHVRLTYNSNLEYVPRKTALSSRLIPPAQGDVRRPHQCRTDWHRRKPKLRETRDDAPPTPRPRPPAPAPVPPAPLGRGLPGPRLPRHGPVRRRQGRRGVAPAAQGRRCRVSLSTARAGSLVAAPLSDRSLRPVPGPRRAVYSRPRKVV